VRMIRVRKQAGFSYIEVLVASLVLAVLATAAIPIARWDEKRSREKQLKVYLTMMRSAIDQYKKYADEGLIIPSDIDQQGYPLTLEELVDGVDVSDPNTPESRTVQFLYRIPVDPLTEEPVWGLRSYQDDFDSDNWGGENVYDVYSLATMVALDGTYYSDW